MRIAIAGSGYTGLENSMMHARYKEVIYLNILPVNLEKVGT
jgi:hypothetical protein